jgi:hypothetical protein
MYISACTLQTAAPTVLPVWLRACVGQVSRYYCFLVAQYYAVSRSSRVAPCCLTVRHNEQQDDVSSKDGAIAGERAVQEGLKAKGYLGSDFRNPNK